MTNDGRNLQEHAVSDTNRLVNAKALSTPDLAAIRAAAGLLAPYIVNTPLVRFRDVERSANIYLKLENLQPIGAFKIRPMGNILLNADSACLRNGVYTASSGNAGLGLAWMAKELGLAATVYAPESAPADKLAAIRRCGAQVRLLSDCTWWQLIREGRHPHDPGMYVDAVRNVLAMAGNGTIGLEIIEQLPDVESVIIPFGGGGLSCGIATAVRALKPGTRVIVAESDTAAPVTAALRAGRPVTIETRPSFISGAGAPAVLEEMWPLVSTLVDDTVVVPVSAVENAVRLLFDRCKVVAEGAAAIALAAALADRRIGDRTVCIVSGGNISSEVITEILGRQIR